MAQMRAASEARGSEDGVGDLIGRQVIDGDRDVGGAVQGEAALVAGFEVGLIGEDGARIFSAAAASEGDGQGDFKMDEERSMVREKQGARFGSLDGAAAQSENKGVCVGQAGDGGVFAVAEGGLAVLREELRDGRAGFGLEDVVGVEKAPAEALGDHRADSGFTGAHESGENDAANGGVRGVQAGLSSKRGALGPV